MKEELLEAIYGTVERLEQKVDELSASPKNAEAGSIPVPPDFVIASPKNFRQRVWRFSDVLPSALFGGKPPCSEVA